MNAGICSHPKKADVHVLGMVEEELKGLARRGTYPDRIVRQAAVLASVGAT